MEEDSVEQMFEMQNLDLLEEPRKLVRLDINNIIII
jgi:hypothetical protein